MDYIFKRILRYTANFIDVAFGMSRKIDYKTLNRYILEINQIQGLEGMLNEVSTCLKDMLNYKLFAFSVKAGEKLEAWIDPGIYESTLEPILARDFGREAEVIFHHWQHQRQSKKTNIAFHSDELLSYVLLDKNYVARIYILPSRKMLNYHHEIMTVITKTLGNALSNLFTIRHLENAAAIDPLTDCYNRREFQSNLERHISTAHRYGKQLSIIMFDLDHFKKVNDTYGHQAGDTVLREVSRAIRLAIRKGDYLSRYGGEEFVVALPETKRSRALELAERLRVIIEKLDIPISNDQQIRVTASFGVAALKSGIDSAGLLKEADSMLYQAKAGGRNIAMPRLKLCAVETT